MTAPIGTAVSPELSSPKGYWLLVKSHTRVTQGACPYNSVDHGQLLLKV